MAKLICPIHGYYDASEGSCPMCRGQVGGPQGPVPLDDDMPTEIGRGNGYFDGGFGDDSTELGQGMGGGSGFTDKTELGQAYREDVTEIEFKDEGPIGLLWVKEGPRRGQIHRIKDGSVIGRSRGDILLDEPKASSSHAKFTFEDEKFFIWDFGTRNGTYVNGERIRSATKLEENDQIKIGELTFVFKVLD